MTRPPDFIIIGAMKCATSTLHEELAVQDGVFMSTPKEPCFFSDDEVYLRGMDWYTNLFSLAEAGDVCGESSTHYTKRPALPKTIERMREHLPRSVKFIYVIRHPIDRLISHYIHDWSDGRIRVPLEQAIERHSDLIDVGRYAMQIRPFIEEFGPKRLLLIPFEGVRDRPQCEFDRLCKFLGIESPVKWDKGPGARNVSSQRLRKNAIRDAVVWNPVVTRVRRTLGPQAIRDRIKGMWQMKERPTLTEATRRYLSEVFDADLSMLSDWIGRRMSCADFSECVLNEPLDWSGSLTRSIAR